MCMAEIALHCYNGFAFSQSNDALWFTLHAEFRTDLRSSGSPYYSCKHIVHAHGICAKRCSCASLRKPYEVMNTLQKITSLYLSFL